MPAGSLSFLPPIPGLGGTAAPVGVFLNIDGSLISLPHIQVWQISYYEGDDPPTARFGYITDDLAQALGWPTDFAELWPLNPPGGVSPYAVLPGDRIDVYAGMPDGSIDLLFDGFARMPQVDVAGDQQMVSFTAVGVAIRAYDIPIQGRIQRNGSIDQIETTDGTQDVATNLPTRFNPANERYPTGQPNRTPDDMDTDLDGDGPGVSYPVFLDENIDRPEDPEHSPQLWTLSDAIEYILSVCNPEGVPIQEGDDPGTFTYQQFVTNPDFSDLEFVLDSRQPVDDGSFYDPSDPSTYTANPIVLRDFDATNMAWPEAVSRLLGYHGFGMRWLTGQDADGLPVNTFEVYRKDAGAADFPKWLFLAPRPSPIAPAASNVGRMRAAFDYHGVANSFVVETHPNRYEVSVVLAPLFEPAEGDAAKENRPQFLRSKLDAAAEDVRRKYRWYGVDELGDGYWDNSEDDMITDKPFDFSDIWPPTQDPFSGEDVPSFCYRLRPGIRDLISDDGNGDSLKAELAVSRDYEGDVPAIWDGSGNWQPIEGDWRLLEDRLGIEFTADDPEAIHCGKSALGAQTQNSGSILKGITSIAKPGADGVMGQPNTTDAYFYLRLTVVIEGDQTIEGTASRRVPSPLANEIRRRINAKDHFRKDAITTSSSNYNQQQLDHGDWNVDDHGNLLARDDTDAANDFAAQMRAAHEFPAVPIAVTIPYLSLAYGVGDRISQIYGHNVSLQTNAAGEQGEGLAFPFVTAVSFEFSGDVQRTVLQLSDRRMEPQPLEHRRGR